MSCQIDIYWHAPCLHYFTCNYNYLGWFPWRLQRKKILLRWHAMQVNWRWCHSSCSEEFALKPVCISKASINISGGCWSNCFWLYFGNNVDIWTALTRTSPDLFPFQAWKLKFSFTVSSPCRISSWSKIASFMWYLHDMILALFWHKAESMRRIEKRIETSVWSSRHYFASETTEKQLKMAVARTLLRNESSDCSKTPRNCSDAMRIHKDE